MYRVIWLLPGAGDDHGYFLEDVLPAHADALGEAGCWKILAGGYQAEEGPSLVIEAWVDSPTTLDQLLASDAATAFRSALERISGTIQELRGGVDEVVTMHLSLQRMS